MKKKYIHIIGICGVTMAPLAVLYKNMGWTVTGSDRAFFPPMSTYLEKNGIKIMPGFKKEHLDSDPDMVLVMAFITEKNPEIIAARRKKIPIKVYADVLPELIEKENSVVISGDCGKTSTTAIVAWLLDKAGYNPSFMIGGLPLNFEHGIRRTSSNWSVMEGDEYVASSWDDTPRFLYYNPKYLILTDIMWDHMDKFKSEKKYIDIFKKLVAKVPKDGAIIANVKGSNIKKVIQKSKAPVLFYSTEDFKGFSMPLKGDVWRQNASAAIVLGRHLGIDSEIIKETFMRFAGVRRRQEVRLNTKNIVIIDDNAHTPIKVSGALQAISETHPGYKICAIYEPGNRTETALKQDGYKNCFMRADIIIFPRQSFELAEKINGQYKNCQYIEDDNRVVSTIQKIAHRGRLNKKKVAFVFMSQKGFRGMIEQAISLLR